MAEVGEMAYGYSKKGKSQTSKRRPVQKITSSQKREREEKGKKYGYFWAPMIVGEKVRVDLPRLNVSGYAIQLILCLFSLSPPLPPPIVFSFSCFARSQRCNIAEFMTVLCYVARFCRYKCEFCHSARKAGVGLTLVWVRYRARSLLLLLLLYGWDTVLDYYYYYYCYLGEIPR